MVSSRVALLNEDEAAWACRLSRSPARRMGKLRMEPPEPGDGDGQTHLSAAFLVQEAWSQAGASSCGHGHCSNSASRVVTQVASTMETPAPSEHSPAWMRRKISASDGACTWYSVCACSTRWLARSSHSS